MRGMLMHTSPNVREQQEWDCSRSDRSQEISAAGHSPTASVGLG